MRYPTVTSFYFATLLAFNAPDGGVPGDDLRKTLHRDQMMAKIQNGEEVLPKVSTLWLRRTNVTDDRRICDSEDPKVTWSRSGRNAGFAKLSFGPRQPEVHGHKNLEEYVR